MSKVRNNFAWEIVLIACNLRLAIIIRTPLIDKIGETFKLSTVQLGILTTIPLLCFGFISILISLLIKKIGTRRTIIIGLFLLMLANFFRIYTESLIFVGTLFVGVAITILNVTLPALVVDYAEEKSAFLNGLYIATSNLISALAGGVIVPLSNLVGWENAIQVFSLPALIAGVGAILLPKKEIELDNKVEILEKEKVWQRHAIWLLAIFMGLQSLVFYTLVAWLPSVLVNHGISPVTAGWMFAAFQMIGFPFSYVVPKLASRLKSARLTMLLLLVGYILGVGILIVVKDNLWLLLLACLINGITTGTSFALSLYLITVFSSSKEEVGQVSGFVQSIGYLLASSGPVIFGILKDTFNNWNTTLLCLLLVAAFTATIGLIMIEMGRQHFLRLNK